MQPWFGNTTAAQRVLGSAPVAGLWVLVLHNHARQPFSGTLEASLDFAWHAGTGDADTATCACECADAPPAYRSSFEAKSLCQPMQQPPEQCNGAAPLPGFAHQKVTCQRVPELAPADMQQCREHDCALTQVQRGKLADLQGASALTVSKCTFWQNCGVRHEFRVGTWSACSHDCWHHRQEPSTMPRQTRTVQCLGTSLADNTTTVLPLLECVAAGLGDAPEAARGCNLVPCPAGGCRVRIVNFSSSCSFLVTTCTVLIVSFSCQARLICSPAESESCGIRS